jgi:hypothetical protein
VIDPRDHQLVDHQLVDHQLVDLPRVLPPVHHHEKNVQHEADEQIAQVQVVRFLKVVKSAIHAGFALLRKNAINREFVHESLNQIFPKMSQVKS